MIQSKIGHIINRFFAIGLAFVRPKTYGRKIRRIGKITDNFYFYRFFTYWKVEMIIAYGKTISKNIK